MRNEPKYRAWKNRVLDLLNSWLTAGSEERRELLDLDVNGYKRPSDKLIRFAKIVAVGLEHNNANFPQRVVPNGDGGIAFERWRDINYAILEINADMTVDLLIYKKSRLFQHLQNVGKDIAKIVPLWNTCGRTVT